jgi:phosphatidylglycerol:prolipoprotein diacylglycerol transferase
MTEFREFYNFLIFISIVVFIGIGRIGCQVSGDGDWGVAANMALKPNWLPEWFWAQTYENNITGLVIQSSGVYPTPIYESLTAFCIFIFLWFSRTRSFAQGNVFSIYLLLSGFGRLLIEKIRINSEYTLFNINFTQAEFISLVLILWGLFGILKNSNAQHAQKIALSLMVFGALTACSKL